ncbi:alkyl hydroperoxide reductase and/or thiol-specific antioxidant family (AhpC/TSA) protein [Halarchaeum acidiphilum MH1-52-1]|uniref:Alkyl hydroperoxide reductase and/or thiol-specific antioxidant family (AhpC/TSA) protein n=1 Tax=Halarchaeum acidiphilum MH1-52-1 TaxID=1261545 RepID=U2YFZ9_9EURY|nr:thioredoxin family protein [Halarchaeum acidiphilum]GAD53111.1 alkyl hydroperoxide reductase and/or thiol-specific antioxidant family (AhpC/TSA) protein [Halarchaeum acidiphilum MH1-52-1]
MAGESTRVLERGDEAPSFSLPGVDGETHAPADFADAEALLVVFTCNHCPYAKAKHPALNAIADDYDEAAVVGINPNDADAYPADSFDGMREEVDSGRIDYDAYLRDESQDVAAAYGAVCTPDPFLFARRDGAFELVYHGRLDDALNPDAEPSGDPGFEMREIIDDVLAGETIDAAFRPSRGCTIKWREGNEPDYWDDV